MHNTKNLISAIVISCAILFGWQYFYTQPRMIEAQKLAKIAQEQQISAPKLQTDTDDIKAFSASPAEEIEVGSVEISTPRLHGSISLRGARLNDLTLLGYKTTNSEDAEDVILLSDSKENGIYFAEFGWVSGNGKTKVPSSKTAWKANKELLTPSSPVKLSWDNKSGLRFFIDISIDKNYMLKFARRVENYGTSDESVLSYGRINRSKQISKDSFIILHEGLLGVFDGILTENRYEDMKDDKKQEFKNSKGWLGITDKYWLTAIIPDKNNSFNASFTYFNKDNKDRYQADYLGQSVDLAPGEQFSEISHLFAGAKKVGLLDTYGTDLDIELFDRAVDFGWLYFITKPIFKALTYFYHVLGNFGLAILLLTIILKALLFPLANKSYVSMHHMKILQPKIVELKERYKDDKAQLNKEIMEMYKKEKVNPMAGCLPILVQIPIFFALYKVLFVTIEMRHAPFYGWITDLSLPDPTSLFNLFGLLPWSPPAFLMIGMWPLIMGITMVLQQKMNPKPADPVQAKVMGFLPYVFIFLFATFPAGLVIYWAWNNTLSVAQQWIITRRLPQK